MQMAMRIELCFSKMTNLKHASLYLESGDTIPACQRDSYIMFNVLKGEVLLQKNQEISMLKENQIFTSESALVSMKTRSLASNL